MDRILGLVAPTLSDYADDMTSDGFSQTAIEVRAAQAGDLAAMDALFARYVPKVARIAAARMGKVWQDLGLEDDIVQETFLDAFTAIREGRIRNEAAFTSWLATCVQRNIQDAIAKNAAAKRGSGKVARFCDLEDSMLSASILPGDEPTASQVAVARESEQRLELALSQVSERYREVICLRVYCHMSYREIAAEMGIPTENTANLLFLRARKELQRRLES